MQVKLKVDELISQRHGLAPALHLTQTRLASVHTRGPGCDGRAMAHRCEIDLEQVGKHVLIDAGS